MNLVYVLTCTICKKQYVGETETNLAARMNGHKNGIRSGSSEEYSHFSCDVRHSNTPMLEKFTIQVAERIYDNDDIPKKRAKVRRLERELAWMLRLQTIYPLGLNTRIKGIGIANQEGKHRPFNLFALSVSYDKNLKKRKTKPRKREHRPVTLNDCLEFVRASRECTISSFIADIRKKTRKFLNKCSMLEEFNLLSLDKQRLMMDWMGYTQPVENLFKAKEPKLYFEVSFKHKIIQKLNLRRIMCEQDVVNLIPSDFKYRSTPKLYFKYGKNIGSKILNYNPVLKSSVFRTFEEIQSLTCNCDTQEMQQFCDNHHGHVLTGDLSIVKNHELRSLMEKGAKFRESPVVTWSQIENSLHTDIDNFVDKWSCRESSGVQNADKLRKWKEKVKSLVSMKLNGLNKIDLHFNTVLNKPEVRRELERIHGLYVVTVVDKCANNFALI